MNPKFHAGPALQRLIIFTVIVALVSACSKDKASDPSTTTQPTGLYSVTGTITNIEAGASGVSVTLSNSGNNYIGQASISGVYSIDNVQPGDYTLKIVQEKSNGHVERNVKAAISSVNLVLNLVLPDPVKLSSPAHTNHAISLSWTRSHDIGFREYRLYRLYDPGLDETTGTLMDVFTKPADTAVTDSFEQMNNGGLSPNTTYYYRVMVMDEFGKIAGSNVLAVTTDKYPPVKEMYTLEPVLNFPGNGNLGSIHGVAFDGNYLWIEYWNRNSPNYYDTAVITLVQYDYKSNTSLKTYVYKGVYPFEEGLEFGGNYLWMQILKPDQIHMLYKIDPADGKVVNSFTTDDGVRDLSFYNNAVYLNYFYNKIELINPDNGGLIETITHNIYNDNTSFGIAVREGEIWLSRSPSPAGFFDIIDANGAQTGYVICANSFVKICFMNNQLVTNDYNRIYIYNIIGRK